MHIYCSFCEPVCSVASKENFFVLMSVYAGWHWNNIWHSSSVDVVQKQQLRWSKALGAGMAQWLEHRTRD